MTREETQKILAVISATYPNFKPEDKTSTIDAWNLFLADYDIQEITIALKTYVNSSGTSFAPSCSQLIDMCKKTEELNTMSETEAWDKVYKAICRSGYNSQEEFEKLPSIIQKVVGSPNQLRLWAIDESFNASVESSNFMRSYRTVIEREKQINRLPSEARAKLENIQRLALEGRTI